MTPNQPTQDIALQFNAAVDLHTSGQLDLAIERYEAMLAVEPEFADALHLLGLAHHQLGNSKLGAETIERAILIKPGEAAYRSNIGSVYKSMGDTRRAIMHLEKAVEIDSAFLPAYYNVAELYCAAGDLAKGEATYRRALQLNDKLPDIWTNLGLCLIKREELVEAEKCLLKALDLQGDFASALYGLAHLREMQEAMEDAKMLLRQAMQFGFDAGSCLRRLATIAHRLKQPEEALEFLNRLVEIGQADASVYNNMALAYQDLEQPDKERAALERALELDPVHVESLCNHAAYLNRMGDFEKAIEQARLAIGEDPKCDIAYNNLGASYKGLAKLEDAIGVYKRAIELRSDRAEYFNNLALAQEFLGQFTDMELNYREAQRLDPNYVPAYANFGSALLNLGRLTEAKTNIDRALIIDSGHAVAWNNMARYHYEVGAFRESVSAYRCHLAIEPESSVGLTSLAATQIIRDDTDDASVMDMHKDCAVQLEALVEPQFHDPVARRRQAGDPIRVGFVSSDFRVHSVAFFLEPLFDLLDTERFSIYCYSGVRHKDDVTRRLQARSRGWRDVCDHPDEAIAQLVREDEVDVLVDLSGFTSGGRAKVFAARPAPVQVNWLGYPHSTGMSRMDYRIVDAETDPEGVTLNTEKLVRLPGCFLCYRPPVDAPAVGPLPALKNGYVTFGSFNNLTKLTSKSVKLFSKALHAVAGSKLLLKSHQAVDPTIQRRLVSRFEAEGVGLDRIEFLPKFPSMKEHLAAYGRVDIALDTFPYNGTTTTCEALWMGVPVLTLRGTRHASRVSASLLGALGLESFVIDNEEAFTRMAVAKAADLEGLKAVRSGLRERVEKSVLRDEQRFARVFGEALETMWKSFVGA